MKFETKAIKSTENHFQKAEPIATPIYLSSTYKRNDDGSYNKDLIYSRENNPNRAILEESLAILEKGEVAFAFGSGMGAIGAVLQSLKSGDHVIIPDDAYYALPQLSSKVFARWGLEMQQVDMTSLEEIKKAIKPNTSLIWAESPSNPLLKISDIQAIAKMAHEHGVLCAIDNTWPTPVLQNPIDLGADVVVHSTTKYFGGHSDVLGGAIVLAKDGECAERIKNIQHLMGAVPSPFDCWLISRGINSLSLRVKAQSESAHKLAGFLNGHPEIEEVRYPGLPTHPNHEIAKKQMQDGFGAMLSVLVKGDSRKSLDISNQLQYFATATSLGGVESLVEHRQSAEGPDSKVPENLLRISVGLENVEDLIDDWSQVLDNEEPNG